MHTIYHKIITLLGIKIFLAEGLRKMEKLWILSNPVKRRAIILKALVISLEDLLNPQEHLFRNNKFGLKFFDLLNNLFLFTRNLFSIEIT